MSEVEKIRVVPNGKIYRQMFEAQALLHHQLTKPKSRSKSVTNKGLPLIQTSREATEQDFLNSRQRTWLNGLPFDTYTENPVLYRQYTNFVQARNQSPTEKALVQALPEQIVSSQHSSNIVERIENTRRVRHEAALEEFSHELTLVASKMEQYVEEAAVNLSHQLELDDAELESLISTIKSDEDISRFTYKTLEQLWRHIEDHLPKRQNHIQQLDEKFNKLEEIRLTQVQEIFLKYAKIFDKISYKNKNETKRMMDNLAQMVNQTLLCNRMNYTNIYLKLITMDTERERKQHNYWAQRVEFWKKLNIRSYIDQFREYITSKKVTSPPAIEELKKKMVAEHTSLNDRYIQLLNALRDIYPPKWSQKLIEEWTEKTQIISRGMYEVAGSYVLEIEKTHEENMQKYMEKLEDTKTFFIMNQFCDLEMASELLERFLPLIKDYDITFNENMVELKSDIDKEFTNTNSLITDMSKYLESVAALWFDHETGLAKQEKMLDECLQHHRNWHNKQTQKREAKLDSILDKMRQGANESILTMLLNQTKTILETIHICYQEFYTNHVKILKTYPSMVIKQLEHYEDSVCNFFKLKKEDLPVPEVSEESDEIFSHMDFGDSSKSEKSDDDTDTQKSLDPPEDTPQIIIEENESPTPQVKSEDGGEDLKSEISNEVTPTDNEFAGQEGDGDDKSAISTPRNPSSTETEIELVLPPCVFTDAGTKYLCLSKEEQMARPEPEEEVKENVRHLYISDEFIQDIKLQIRMNYLNHLDTWIIDAKNNSEHAVIAKLEEFDAEFNLRLQLHVPRVKRIEQDVYNVRAGELLLHSRRVSEHCQGVDRALAELKDKYLAVKQNQEKMMEEFNNEIEAMEPSFVNITKSGRLITLRNQISMEMKKVMVNIRTNLRMFRVQLDKELQTVRESNASLVQNFKLFSDGGNFCPDEVDEFHKTIEDISTMIDHSEVQILVEMEGMEANQFDLASRITIEFEERFKNHIFDLLFVETVARWLTNTQVQVKAHVANSNTNSKNLSNFLSTLKQRIEVCEQRNPDFTKIEASEIAELFESSFEMISSRAKYLKCLKTTDDTVPVAPSRAGYSSEVPFVMKQDHTMLEDSSVGMIKSILRSQKISEANEQAQDSSTEDSSNSNTENGNDSSPTTKTGNRKSRYAVQKSPSRIYKRHIIINHATKAVKLNLNFGDTEQKDLDGQEIEDEPSDFLRIIRQLVQNTFLNVGTTADEYYRQKGTRPITRPQVLHETYENCAEALGDKLVSYYTQTKEYLQRCHAEFRSQLEELECLAKRIPPLLFRDFLEQHLNHLDEEFSQWEKNFQHALQHLEKEQKCHMQQLQPNLGHPQKSAQLEKLNEDEIKRHKIFNREIEKYFQEIQKRSIKCSESFILELTKLCEKYLQQFDDLLVSSEVLPGKCDISKGKPDFRTPDSEKPKTPNEKKRTNWLGLSYGELYTKTSLKSPFARKTSPVLSTAKNTLPQQSTVQSRNDVFQIYIGNFERKMVSMDKRRRDLLHGEKKWFENWKTSLENIRQLFV